MFNIAQCHFNLRNWERAAFFYEGFLRDAPVSPASADAKERLIESRRLQAREDAEAAARPKPVAATQPSFAPRELVASAPAAVSSNLLSGQTGPVPVYKRWWFWTIIGVLVAGGAATASVVFLVPPRSVPPSGSTGTVDWRP